MDRYAAANALEISLVDNGMFLCKKYPIYTVFFFSLLLLSLLKKIYRNVTNCAVTVQLAVWNVVIHLHKKWNTTYIEQWRDEY